MKRLTIIIDMQKDFVDGALSTREAQQIVEPLVRYVKDQQRQGTEVVFTMDTHFENYLDTQEGKNLPVPHCIKGTAGWELIEQLKPLAKDCRIFEKPTFGSMELADFVRRGGYEEIALAGLCTDICVISNAMLLKAAVPESNVAIISSCCAGVTPESHENALKAMRMCQIVIS